MAVERIPVTRDRRTREEAHYVAENVLMRWPAAPCRGGRVRVARPRPGTTRRGWPWWRPRRRWTLWGRPLRRCPFQRRPLWRRPFWWLPPLRPLRLLPVLLRHLPLSRVGRGLRFGVLWPLRDGSTVLS